MYISNTGRGNGATGVHGAFSDGYQGESIEHSLMDPKRGRRGTKCTTVCAAGNIHACFAIDSLIIVGVLATQSMSASTNNQCQLHQNNQCQLQQMRNTVSNCALASIRAFPDGHQGSSHRAMTSILKWTPQREAGAQTHILSFSMKLARETHILASNLQLRQ